MPIQSETGVSGNWPKICLAVEVACWLLRTVVGDQMSEVGRGEQRRAVGGVCMCVSKSWLTAGW